jgi:hypothetical protein
MALSCEVNVRPVSVVVHIIVRVLVVGVAMVGRNCVALMQHGGQARESASLRGDNDAVAQDEEGEPADHDRSDDEPEHASSLGRLPGARYTHP